MAMWERNAVAGKNNPELIFGLVGPIGVDINCVTHFLTKHLNNVGYKCERIKIIDLMKNGIVEYTVNDSSTFTHYQSLIENGNNICSRYGNDALARLAISDIRKRRRDEDRPRSRTAYIIQQLKRVEEIALLRNTYGGHFIQVSLHSNEDNRIQYLINKSRINDAGAFSLLDYTAAATALVARDHNEHNVNGGQRVAEIFHLGDIFVDGENRGEIDSTIERFIKALFGWHELTPSKDEYGMYLAATAASRSSDSSRQVGAAIFSCDGEIITVGCNEVPKAGGGTYWGDSQKTTYHDIDREVDINHVRRKEVLANFIARLYKIGALNMRINDKRYNNIRDFERELIDDRIIETSKLLDIMEFGKLMHAEMSSIVDAARLGRPLKGATLYCTTFPCHMCAKHIVGAGISRVVFLEPYPKSQAQDIHNDSISVEGITTNKVLFESFRGIAPRRYCDIFENRAQKKDKKGSMSSWIEGEPIPRIENRSTSYLQNETDAIELDRLNGQFKLSERKL